MWHSYPFKISLPHTNYRGVSESRLLMEACNFFWSALADEIKCPVSKLRNSKDEPVYATISFIDEYYPSRKNLSGIKLDDELIFFVSPRSGGPLASDGRIIFDSPNNMDQENLESLWNQEDSIHPRIRLGSLFATPSDSGSILQLTPPINAQTKNMDVLPPEENPARITRNAQKTGRLGLISDDWSSLDGEVLSAVDYKIDPDRDTNAAGLVYFANYVAFMEIAERHALKLDGCDWTQADMANRQLTHRRVAYYGAADIQDTVNIQTERFTHSDKSKSIGLRCRLSRKGDDKLLCVSESIFFAGSESKPKNVENVSIVDEA